MLSNCISLLLNCIISGISNMRLVYAPDNCISLLNNSYIVADDEQSDGGGSHKKKQEG